MSSYLVHAADLVAVAALIVTFVTRHGRRELVVAFLGVNVGVLAVTTALASSTVGAGLGLGLFGVLSIIRLRSEELAQREVAYYFAALALGLLGGLAVAPVWLPVTFMALVVAAVWVGDHPGVRGGVLQQDILVDRALTQPATIVAQVERLLGVEVVGATVRKLDLVNDTTLVTVRHRAVAEASRAPKAPAAADHLVPSMTSVRGGAA